MKGILSFILIGVVQLSFGQIESDNNWILTNYIHFQFDSSEIESNIINHPNLGLLTSSFNTAISSTQGDLLFHSSGCFVMDKNSFIMEDGDSLNPGISDYGYCSIGDAVWYQNVLILPFPDSESKYILFTLDVGDPFPFEDTMYIPLVPLHLYYHIIDMDLNGGNGKVTLKNTIAIEDTLSRGYMQACRHANGRDWWITIPEWNSNCYYTIYLSPEGISSPIKSCSGPSFGDKDFGAEVAFSPDGNWYARSFAWGDDSVGRVELYNFDRCSGSLIHYSSIYCPIEFPYYTGLSFSPKSNFLYVTTYKTLWQFDLSQHDVQNSILKVGEIDEPISNGKGSLYFQQLTPNGEVFIASPGNHLYLSLIQKPNNKGVECGFEKYKIKYPENHSNYFGLPNYPNYRLGPVDGTECDSLGINNLPIAKFKYEIIPGSQFDVDFTNLSYFEPDSFRWDFGDFDFSNLSDPVHHFNEEKVYSVCLTAQNQYGSNTYCHDISLISTHTATIITNDSIILYPNPANREVKIFIPFRMTKDMTLRIFNSLGKMVSQQAIIDEVTSINLEAFPSSFYYITLANEHGVVKYFNSFIKLDVD